MNNMPLSNDSGFHDGNGETPVNHRGSGRPSEGGIIIGEPAIDDYELHPINKRVDIGLSDQELVMQSTKTLNKMIKKRGITKERAKQIKQERRTLKNRGYAANCRVKRENEEKKLERENDNLRREICRVKLEIDLMKGQQSELSKQYQLIDREVEDLKREQPTASSVIGEDYTLRNLMSRKFTTDIKVEKMDPEDPMSV